MCVICKEMALGRLTVKEALLNTREVIKEEGKDPHLDELQQELTKRYAIERTNKPLN